MKKTPPATTGTTEVGVAMLFNPTDELLHVNISLPLYYTGLSDTALIGLEEGAGAVMKLARDYSVQVEVTIPKKSATYLVISPPPSEGDSTTRPW
jgi:hypothetical protein